MNFSSMKQRSLTLGSIAIIAGFSQQAIAQSAPEGVDPTYSDEVLASAPFKDREGSIEIRRVTEDGVDGVAIVRSGLIGDYYTPPSDRARLPMADQVWLVYEELTGQELPPKAYQALHAVQELKARSAAADRQTPTWRGIAMHEMSPRSACQNISPLIYYFYFDCYVHGPRKGEATGADDVCLLTAAIHGNHGMQVSYKSVNGTFYNNFSKTVKQGHYVAYELRTDVKRTRKGHIYDASESDYSRYNFDGDYYLWDRHHSAEFPCHLATG